MKRNSIRFFLYFGILLLAVFLLPKLQGCVGIKCHNRMIEIGSFVNFIPVIEIVYQLYHQKNRKRKLCFIGSLIFFIFVVAIFSRFYGNYLEKRSKCTCAVAQCVDDQHKNCYVKDENNEPLCTIDCSIYLQQN